MDLGFPDHEHSPPHLPVGKFLDAVGQDETAGGQPVVLILGHHDTDVLRPHVAALQVLEDQLQLVAAGTQGHGTLIEGFSGKGLLEQGVRNVLDDRILEDLNHPPRDGGHPAEDVDLSPANSLLVLEGHILVEQLDGDGRQHGIFGDPQKVGSGVEGEQVVGNLGVDHGLQVGELDLGGALQGRILGEALELIVPPAPAAGGGAQCHPGRIGEAVRLAGHSHALHGGQPGVGDIQQGVLLGGIHGHAVFAGHGGVDEFDQHLIAQVRSLQVAVAPDFEGVGAGDSPAFVNGTGVAPAARMGLDFVGRTEGNVDPPPIRQPPRGPGREPLVGIGDAPVMLIPGLVHDRIGIGIPPQPELFDELVPFIVGGQLPEGSLFFLRNDVTGVFTNPLLEIAIRGFPLERLLPLPFLLGRLPRESTRNQNRGHPAEEDEPAWLAHSHGQSSQSTWHRSD